MEVKIDPRLVVAPELIKMGLLMPARLTRIGFGAKSQSLYEAVKMLTGLDQLADIADGFTHAGRKFLRYGKENGIEGFKTKFDENMARAEVNAQEPNFTLPDHRAVDDKNVVQNLQASAAAASVEAESHLALLKSEISAELDIITPAGRLKVRNAVATARAVANQRTKGIVAFEAWAALKG